MSTDYRALCAELVADWDSDKDDEELLVALRDLIDRARTALAQPEPVGPTDEELNDTYWKAWHEHLDRTNSVLHAAGLRAILARWGRPAITPVPAGGLVSEVAWRVAAFASEAKAGDDATPTARAAVLAVAEWLRENDGLMSARWLREEVERGLS